MNKFEIKDKFDKLIYQAYNLTSDILFYCSPKIREKIKSNKNFHNKHYGERCFIIATGPSLNEIPDSTISKLTSETVFAANSLYKSDKTRNITPSYYCLVDNNYWGVSKNTFYEVFENYKNKPPTFLTDIRAIEIIKNIDQKIDILPFYSRHYPFNKIRCDLSSNLSISLNVVSASIQAAIFMGFKKIYLLGCDYTYFCSPKTLHCYEDSHETKTLPKYNLSFYLKYYHLTTEFHYRLAELSKSIGVNIVNVTNGSLLDAYQMADLESII